MHLIVENERSRDQKCSHCISPQMPSSDLPPAAVCVWTSLSLHSSCTTRGDLHLALCHRVKHRDRWLRWFLLPHLSSSRVASWVPMFSGTCVLVHCGFPFFYFIQHLWVGESIFVCLLCSLGSNLRSTNGGSNVTNCETKFTCRKLQDTAHIDDLGTYFP